MNVIICGYEVDAYFPDHGVIVELDGWAFHRDRATFESDRNRDADTLTAGLVTIRITWVRMTTDPQHEAERLHKILTRRRPDLAQMPEGGRRPAPR
jgi:very-short-patch-repair endonuclease